MKDFAARIASAAGDAGALLALAIELANENARLAGHAAALEEAEAERRRAQADRKWRQRHGTSRDVTGQDGTERDVTDAPSLPPSPLSSFPTPHITLTPSPLSPRRDKQPAREEYPAEFLALWELYPRRAGGNSKRDAFRAYSARRNAGVPHEELVAGVERYAAFLRATGKEGTEFVLQAATFFGPSERWREAWSAPAVPPRPSSNGHAPNGDGAEAAWSAVLDMLPAWQRREIDAEKFATLPAPMRRGLREIGGFSRIQNTAADQRTWLKKEFITAYRGIPEHAHG